LGYYSLMLGSILPGKPFSFPVIEWYSIYVARMAIYNILEEEEHIIIQTSQLPNREKLLSDASSERLTFCFLVFGVWLLARRRRRGKLRLFVGYGVSGLQYLVMRATRVTTGVSKCRESFVSKAFFSLSIFSKGDSCQVHCLCCLRSNMV